MEEVARDYAPKGLKVYTVDVTGSPDTAATYGVMAVPTLLFFKAGQVREQAGFLPKSKLIQKVEKVLS